MTSLSDGCSHISMEPVIIQWLGHAYVSHGEITQNGNPFSTGDATFALCIMTLTGCTTFVD